MAKTNKYPFNLLSELTKEEFANSLVFVDGNFLGFTSNVVCKELDFAQYYLFLQQILGANPVFNLENVDRKTLPYKFSDYENSGKSGNVLINQKLLYIMVMPEVCPHQRPDGDWECPKCEGTCINA